MQSLGGPSVPSFPLWLVCVSLWYPFVFVVIHRDPFVRVVCPYLYNVSCLIIHTKHPDTLKGKGRWVAPDSLRKSLCVRGWGPTSVPGLCLRARLCIDIRA